MHPPAVIMGHGISLPSSKAAALCCDFSLVRPYEATGSCDPLGRTSPEHHSQVPVSGRADDTLKRLRVHCHRAASFLLLVHTNLSSTDSWLRGDALLYLQGFLHTDHQEPRTGMTSQEVQDLCYCPVKQIVLLLSSEPNKLNKWVFLKLPVAQVNNKPALTC